MPNDLSQYFIWERPCYPGLVYTPAESCTVPHAKEFGYPWDDTLCFFSNGMVRIVWRLEVMTRNGAQIVRNFLHPAYFSAKMERHDRLAEALSTWFNDIDKARLAEASDREYLGWWKRYNDDFRAWWGFAQVSDVIGMGAEYLLKQKFSLTPEEINILTTPTRMSYTIVEEEGLSEIVKHILAKSPEVGGLLDRHAAKYFWMLNSYAETKCLDRQYFFNVTEEIIKKGISPDEIANIKKNNAARLSEIRGKSASLQKEIGMSDEDKKLVNFIDYFTCFQDDRKAFSLRANHYTDLFIKELGRRGSLHYDLVKFVCPQEYGAVLNGEFELGRLKARQKHFAVLFRVAGAEIYEGAAAEQKESAILGADIDIGINEIEGVRAMGGKVVGQVRKILLLKDIEAMRGGEILVTTMTSPDFISAMRQAKAIITDQGGITCHAAVIARELGIPCVIGTNVATRVLRTGDLVEVRANHGIVRIINRAK